MCQVHVGVAGALARRSRVDNNNVDDFEGYNEIFRPCISPAFLGIQKRTGLKGGCTMNVNVNIIDCC